MHSTPDKVFASPAAAVADIPNGSSVAISGFGVGQSFPLSLIAALRDHGATGLTVVCNSLGSAGQNRASILVENHQVSRLIASFSARPGGQSDVERQIASGEVEMELVPQGTLVERLRAGAAAIPAFYTATGLGTVIAEGKEVREFNGERFVLEQALTVDYALIRGHKADRMGNVQFRGGSENFNPSFAKASRLAIVEVDEIVEVGELGPEDIDLPGLYVARVVTATVHADRNVASARNTRGADTFRSYFDKPALTRTQMAARAAALLTRNSYVNLGIGLPSLVSDYTAGMGIVLHSENGLLGYGELVAPADADPDYFNASGSYVSLLPGSSAFDSVASFEMARAGRLDTVVLGGYQVDAAGNLANWSTPAMVGGGIGGAMDLVAGKSTLVILMEHCDSKGGAKLVDACTYPLTGLACVDIVVTDLALLRRDADGFVVTEIAEGFTPDEVSSLSQMELRFADPLGVMQDHLAKVRP